MKILLELRLIYNSKIPGKNTAAGTNAVNC
jgi:hypothetical protein